MPAAGGEGGDGADLDFLEVSGDCDFSVRQADGFMGEIGECDEGNLEWVPKERVYELPIWEGDKIFFRLLEEEYPFFSLKLRYEKDVLAEAVLDGKPMEGR